MHECDYACICALACVSVLVCKCMYAGMCVWVRDSCRLCAFRITRRIYDIVSIMLDCDYACVRQFARVCVLMCKSKYAVV